MSNGLNEMDRAHWLSVLSLELEQKKCWIRTHERSADYSRGFGGTLKERIVESVSWLRKCPDYAQEIHHEEGREGKTKGNTAAEDRGYTWHELAFQPSELGPEAK